MDVQRPRTTEPIPAERTFLRRCRDDMDGHGENTTSSDCLAPLSAFSPGDRAQETRVYRPPHQRRIGLGISSVPLSRAPGHLPPPPTPNVATRPRPPALKLRTSPSSTEQYRFRGPATAPVSRLLSDTLRRETRDRILERDRCRGSERSLDRDHGRSSPLDSPATPGLSRKRGITMAVLVQDELVAESAPFTPVLTPAPKSAAPILNSQVPESPFPAPIGSGRPKIVGGSTSARSRAPTLVLPSSRKACATPASTPVHSAVPVTASTPPRKELILCRYYHTPGMVCTSSPCRFVHHLPSVAAASPAPSALQVNLGSPAGTACLTGKLTPLAHSLAPTPNPYRSSGSHDPTRGTFAAAQQAAPVPAALELNDTDLARLTSGEAIAVRDATGAEVLGHVFKMSGGGKGPAGKSRLKFRTVPCRDFASGICAYGEYCSFIHDEANLYDESKHGKKDKTEGDAKQDMHVDSAEPATTEATDSETLTVPRSLGLKKAQSINNLMAAVSGQLFPAGLGKDVSTDPEPVSFLSPSFFTPPERPKFTPAHIPVSEVCEKGDEWTPHKDPVPQIDINIHPVAAGPLPSTPPPSLFLDMIPTQPVAQPMRVTHSLSPRSELPPPIARSMSFTSSPMSITSTISLPPPSKAYPWSPPSQVADSDWPDLSNVARTKGKPSPITIPLPLPLPGPLSPASAWGKGPPETKAKAESPARTGMVPLARKGKSRRKNSAVKEAPKESPKTPKVTKSRNSAAAATEWPDLASPASAAPKVTSPKSVMSPIHSVWGKGALKQEPKPVAKPNPSIAAKKHTRGTSDSNQSTGSATSPPSSYSSFPEVPPGCILQSDTVWTPHGCIIRTRPEQSHGTKLCRYFAVGNCSSGAKCGFLHPGPGETAPMPTPVPLPRKKYVCSAFNESTCPLSADECESAHLTIIPAPQVRRTRTRPCHHFLLGRCHMGDDCFFLHVGSGSNSSGSYAGSVKSAPSGVATPTQAAARPWLGRSRSGSEAKCGVSPINVPPAAQFYDYPFRVPHNTPHTPHSPVSPHPPLSPMVEGLSARSSLSSLSATTPALDIPPVTPLSPPGGSYFPPHYLMYSIASSPSSSGDHCPDWAQGKCTGFCPLAHVGETALTEEALAAACEELRRAPTREEESNTEDEDELEIEIVSSSKFCRS